jgi:hypothetical protein
MKWSLGGVLLPLILVAFCALKSSAQTTAIKSRRVAFQLYPFKLDPLTVIPSSIQIVDCPEAAKFSFNAATGILQWTDSADCDSVLILYKTLAVNLNQPVFLRNASAYDSTGQYSEIATAATLGGSYQERREELFGAKNLQKTGNISRGISFGNTQDVFVNSVLNLQLEGKISEELTLTAAISDQNVPLQPEGNTQQLQEFDRVYIQLDHQKGRLTAGDLILRNGESMFMRYLKNVQGGQVVVRAKPWANATSETSAGVAVAKGKFSSQFVPVLEGVLGPYRLRGPNNERFIIVIANSEKVFLDGKQLQRGFDYDYVIDYNQGEITFTNRIVITQFTRVRVDFEYSERNYSRTITQASHYHKSRKIDFSLNYYREADNPRSPLTAQLSDADKFTLTQAGDDLTKAVGVGVDSVGFIERQVLYRKVDTLVDAVSYVVYVYDTDPTSAVFRLTFTEVGQGRGNYQFASNTANGRIFRWVAPLNGVPQGSFEPQRLLPTPKELGMVAIGATWKPSAKHLIVAEVAGSVNDFNRFSAIDAADDLGAAFKIGYKSGAPIALGKDYSATAFADYEFNQASFSFIDRLRFVEFDRDWSADPLSAAFRANENIMNAGAQIRKDLRNSLSYQLSMRRRGEAVNGTQQTLQLRKKVLFLQSTTDAFLMQNDQRTNRSEWLRLSQDVHLPMKYTVPGYQYSLERNEVKKPGTDSITFTAMHFEEHKVYVRSPDSSRHQYLADYSLRYDNAPMEGMMQRNTRAETGTIRWRLPSGYRNELNTVFSYRKFTFLRSDSILPNEETFTGRVDWAVSLLKQLVRSELTYALGTGRELRREFIYLAVPVGEGTHFWRDLNGNGVQELDEFFPATSTDQRLFIRLFVPTDEYIKAFTNTLVYRLNVAMPIAWRTRGWFLKQMSRLSSVSSLSLDNKITNDDIASRLNPLITATASGDRLLSTSQNGRATLFYNRTNPSYGADVGWSQVSTRTLLTGGFETRLQEEWRASFRKNFSGAWNTQTTVLSQRRIASSDVLTARNFGIASTEWRQELSYQPENSYRLTGTLQLTNRNSPVTEQSAGANATFRRAGMEFRLNQVQKRTLTAALQYIQIDFTGIPASQLAIEMLEAFLPGNNFTWTLNLQQRLANGLQINVNYEGRKSALGPVVHVGRMQVSALF